MPQVERRLFLALLGSGVFAGGIRLSEVAIARGLGPASFTPAAVSALSGLVAGYAWALGCPRGRRLAVVIFGAGFSLAFRYGMTSGIWLPCLAMGALLGVALARCITVETG